MHTHMHTEKRAARVVVWMIGAYIVGIVAVGIWLIH